MLPRWLAAPFTGRSGRLESLFRAGLSIPAHRVRRSRSSRCRTRRSSRSRRLAL